MSRPSGAPIAILAFNRPDYLREMLVSLTLQEGGNLAGRSIALFQDGGLNEHSGVERAKQSAIDANIAMFKEFFPDGEVAASPINLGVALNFDRAERWAFEKLGAPTAVFLEDDLVLSPHYFSVLDRMLDMAAGDDRIGYVAAYGDWRAPLAKQNESPGKLIALGHHWAFGLTQTQWIRNRPFVEEYLSLVRGHDYVDRPHAKIFEMFSRHGLARIGTSQDTAKMNATYLTGGVRLNTLACLGQYIGREGVHFRNDIFDGMKFDQTEIFPSADIEIERLSDARYQQLLAHQRAAIAGVAPPLGVETQVSFAKGEPGEQAIRSGFHLPEAWGVWSDGERCAIEVSASPECLREGATLWIDARYNLPTGTDEADVRVRINDRDVGTISVGHDIRRSHISLPATPVSNGRLVIAFHDTLVGSSGHAARSDDGGLKTVGLSAVGMLSG
jgi:hypothetical protein